MSRQLTEYAELGINGKNSELHAVMGFTNLTCDDRILAKRRELTALYDQKLKSLKPRRPLWHAV